MSNDFPFGCLRVALMPSGDVPVHQGAFIQPWCLPGNFNDGKAIALNDAEATLESTEELRPGTEVTMRLRPLVSPFWKVIRPRDELILHIGPTPSGSALVLERISETVLKGYFGDRNVTVTPLELEVLSAGLTHGVLLPDQLPDLAAEYVAQGIPSDSLALLAGLDLGRPTDPHEARELLADGMSELRVPVRVNHQSELSAMLLAALTKRTVPLRAAVDHFCRLAVAHHYEHPYREVIALYGMDDEWIGGWGRTEQQLESAATAALQSILSQSEPTFGVLDNQAVQRLARLLPGATRH